MINEEQTGMLDAVARVFLWCFAISIGLMTLWALVYFLMGDFAYGIHSSLFELTRSHFDMMNYYGMAIMKGCSFMFFLTPYIAIKMVLRKK